MLAHHDEIIRNSVEETYGKVIKGLGDAFFIEYPLVFNAFEAGKNIQQKIENVSLKNISFISFPPFILMNLLLRMEFKRKPAISTISNSKTLNIYQLNNTDLPIHSSSPLHLLYF